MNPLNSPSNLPQNPMDNLQMMLRNGANPQVLAQNVIANNPQVANEVQNLQRQCGNQNPKDFMVNYFRQNGADPSLFLTIGNMMGLK